MILAVRLGKQEENRPSLVSKKRHANRSQAAKDHTNRRFFMFQLDEYKAGNVSFGKLAETL